MAAEYPANTSPTLTIPTPGPGVTLANPSLTGLLGRFREELLAITGTLGQNPHTTYGTVKDRLAAMDTAIAAAAASTNTIIVQVTANGTTDAAPAIQTVLDGLSSGTKSYRVLVEGTSKGVIYLNSKVRITTSNTEVSFSAPVLLGTGFDPDGFGGFSIIGTAGSTTSVTSGATRGSSKIVVASTTGITAKTLIKISDNDTFGGQSSGDKAEMAQVVDVSGTTVYLDHPLHHSYTGTITARPITTPVVNSGFSGVNATFTGQQSAGFVFAAKMQYTQFCYFRNMHFRGDPSNSWSRECVSLRDSYRPMVDACTVSFGWDYTVGSTFDYGFSADNATGAIWRSCRATNTRHGFSADKGSAGLLYVGCVSDNTTASAFDLHGGWTRDIVYMGCMATASDTRNSLDKTKVGFLAGNTSFKSGSHWVQYIGCVARSFGPYTASDGGSGESAGFQVVDGSSNIVIDGCRIIDSQYGLWVLSLNSVTGVPIKNVTVTGTVFDNISGGGAPLPIWVSAGAAPSDVDGLFFKGNTFTNCSAMASARVYGTSGNTLANIVFEDNTWIGPGVSGVFPLDIRYVDDPLVTRNTFYKTRRGVMFLGCTSPTVVANTFFKLVDGASASNIVLDSGGANTNILVADNRIVGFTPTSAGTAPTSSGASVEFMTTQRAYATAGRPSAAAVGAGSWYFDVTLGKPAWSTGSAWKDAAGTTV